MQKHASTENYSIQRVLVIGLDGATFDLIKPWTEAGLLPTFKKLFERGTYGVMESTIPVHSTPAWTSIATGKSPCKHGIWYPIELSEGKIKIKSSSDLKCETIWEILNRYGKKVVVFNVPLTYPPQKINGILVTGMETPDLNADITYPEEIKKVLLKMNYEIDLNDSEQHILFYSNRKKLFRRLCSIEEKRVKVAVHLLENYNWDFAFVVLNLLDRCQHSFWRSPNQKEPRNTESSDEENTVLIAYQEICRLIDEMINNFLDERTVIVFVSDHGFGPMNKCFYINNWLKEQGFLQTKKNLHVWLKLRVRNFLKVFLKNRLGANVIRLLYWVKAHARAGISENKALIQKMPRKESLEEIDFYRTKVYSPFIGFGGYGFLKINVEGQENPQGIVSQVDRAEIINALREKLYKVVDPENGQRIVKNVCTKEVFFGNQLAGEVPDLIVETERGYVCHYPILTGKDHIVDMRGTPWNGSHERDGIFLISGLKIKKRFEIGKSTVTDVTPTILYMFGLPIPKDMDGKVITECFEDKYLKLNLLRYSEESIGVTRLTKEYLKEEEEKVKDRLRSLGYL